MEFLYVENGRMSYMPIRRDSESIVGSGQEFLFDALSSVIFGESGSSRVFKKQAQTRSWITVTSCFDVYTGSESIGMTYQYTECNDKLIWIDHFKWHSAPDGGGGGGDGIGFGIDVTGGGGGSGSVTSNAESLFTNDRFTVDNWKITEKLIAKINL